MNSHYYKLLCTATILLLYKAVFTQTPSFHHLTTANGLYDNHVRSLALDKQGLLWIGTEEGLNRYDGHSVSVYIKEKYPGLPSNLITCLFCDSRNRIWIGTNEGVARLDNRNQLHRVVLQDTIVNFTAKAVIETRKGAVILITNRGQFLFDEQQQQWRLLTGATYLLPFEKIKSVGPFNDSKFLFATDSSIMIYDYAENKMAKQFLVPGIMSISKLEGNEIAVGKTSGEIMILNAGTGKQGYKYYLNDHTGNKLHMLQPAGITQASNRDIVISTGLNGLVIISPSGIVSQIVHDPTNPASLISNSTYRLVAGANGEVIIGTSTSGVSMYNTRLTQAAYKGFFTDDKGNYYDNFTGRIVETDDNIIWIGTYDRLIRWDKKTNTSKFYYYLDKDGGVIKRGDIRGMCLDKTGRLWITIDHRGLAFFSEATGSFTKIKVDTSLSPACKASAMIDLMTDNDGLIWVSTNKGIFTINPATKKIDGLTNHPLLKELSGQIVHSVFLDSKKRKWFATYHSGVYCYDKMKPQLIHYTAKDGLPSDICYMVREDRKGRYFIPASKGLVILHPNGSIQSFTRQNGLRYDRCESVMIDNENIAWFSNKNCLVRLDPDSNKMEFFDEKAGFLNDGFRVGSCLKTKTGELLWGGYRGVSYFDPKKLRNTNLPLQVNIYSVQVQDSVIDITNKDVIRVSYANNNITFGFVGVHLGIPGKTYYQYKLQGFDQHWQKEENIQQARYTVLPPGAYLFELKASTDGVHWVTAAQKISIVIVPPLWMRWWFIVIIAILFATIIYVFIKTRNNKIRVHKEEVEAEQAINYFASSLHEQQTVDAILWDVARNCIGRLQFEDCVIYLLDEDRNILVQKAAYGPKSPKNLQISGPIEIPVGKGIVGSVVVTGKAELIADTTKDDRYIVDDQQRLSEIAVPLIWGGKVIGVIDCEHPKKGYFTQKHLSILTTIASLCANKIIRARAEDEKQKAQAILSNTERKMAEVEMQALRAQMNPHFIFNCLNSINRYIVKSDQATASLYLTRFAKLIRLILDNSSSKNVLLSNELEALKLYMEMESLRFDKKFSYQITVDRNVSTDSIELPPLIIQPYVENAIWHGLLHKEGGGQLTINIKLIDEGMLECTIEDNGVGRRKAGELKSKSATSRKSLGMQLTEKRLGLLNRHAELNTSISIIDMEDEQQQPTGTKVILRIPV